MVHPYWFAVSSGSLTGVLCLLTPGWVLLVAAGVVLHAGVQCKGKLPSVIRDVMEYGKLKEGNLQKGFSSALNIPKSARMHVTHYLLGMFFYPGVAFTTLLHLGTAHYGSSSSSVGVSYFYWHHYVAVGMFLWSSIHQHKCHQILADLRNARKNGSQEDHSYRQPNGDWFELVSCPHFLAEVIIYASMLLVFVPSDVWSVWWLVVVYVVTTLSLSARQTHAWYKVKFKDYPHHRYAIIPWLY